MTNQKASVGQIDLEQVTNNILAIIDQDREREIITRRFGLKERKETLEQIGNFLDITRERVRQLEKAIVIRLKIAAEDKKSTSLAQAEKVIIRNLIELGRVAKVCDLANHILGRNSSLVEQSQIAFIAEISSQLTVIDENDNYHQAVGIIDYGDKKEVKKHIDEIVSIISKNKRPISIDDLDAKLNYEHPSQIEALAKVSKKLATLNNTWGLNRWPEVNPKNIKDKIYVILSNAKQPMHFSEINRAIKESDFKRKDVTDQAVHNELIKDSRFILIGRGIYALSEWGYKKGTVFDVISDVLRNGKEPMSRDDIVRQVLKRRKVKETTVLLNLQSRPEFKRVAKGTYTLASQDKE